MFDHAVPPCSTLLIFVALLSGNVPLCFHREVQPLNTDFATSDRFASYLAFHSDGRACRVLTGERHSFLMNCAVLLLACVCQNTSIAWLTHQFKVARFVGCPATVATPHQPTSLLPAMGIETFSHA